MMIKKTMKSSRKLVGQAIRPTAKYIFQPHKSKLLSPTNNLESEKLLNGSGGEEEEILLDGEKRRLRLSENYKIAPKGWLVVYVGAEERRYVIPTKYLSMPEFGNLMDKVADEFGHQHGPGGLRIPNCQVDDFERMIIALATRSNNKKRSSHI